MTSRVPHVGRVSRLHYGESLYPPEHFRLTRGLRNKLGSANNRRSAEEIERKFKQFLSQALGKKQKCSSGYAKNIGSIYR